MTRKLAGMAWRPHSPSLYELDGFPVAVIMDQYRQWHVWMEPGYLRADQRNHFANGFYGRPLPTLDAAAQLVAHAFGVKA